MKSRELRGLGVPAGEGVDLARKAAQAAKKGGMTQPEVRTLVASVTKDPQDFVDHKYFGGLAQWMVEFASAQASYRARRGPAPWKQWGRDLERTSIEQMENACALPISVRGALMPDAHQGYGLPIGGVLATDNAVIPYAVGVDIACRVKLTVLDLPLETLDSRPDWLRRALEKETRFGVGSEFKDRRQHRVLDENWAISPVTKELKDKAWAQLGTSGSGNHFVEYGELEVADSDAGIAPGRYLALLSHSGSRGTGASVCDHYSKIAMRKHRELPPELRHLAWLELDTDEGEEYWEAMELMGKYASANHELIHKHIAAHLGAGTLLDIENHHNFAWKERHDGKTLIVHRKGATPAGEGALGIIPGSMATPGYIVRGKGNPQSLNSAAHGAGRVMSRKQAKKTFNWRDAKRFLEERRVTLISAGLDEVPMVYKDIDQVMAAQRDLVEPLARFMPRLVKMAPAGERPED
jgi:tRNA-splicing ligase RtcB (3'-phosphate/5'-hydroxy nucleic acid ligase)